MIKRTRKLLSITENNEIIELYTSGISSQKVAEKLNRSPHAVRDALKRNNITIRYYLSPPKPYFINGNFNVDAEKDWIL